MCTPTTLFLLVSLLLLLLLISSPTAVSSPLSTVAVSKASNQTVVCALLPDQRRARYRLNCTALPSGRRRSYSSGLSTFSAIAAGNGFLCALASPPSSSNLSSMRWWEFTPAVNRTTKRVYRGPAIEALASGDSHVCGVIGGATRELHCWRWPQLSLPRGLNFSEIAVGGDFLCVLLSSKAVRCFSGDGEVAGMEPAGNYTAIAAGSSHACAVSIDGALACWGAGAPDVPTSTLEVSALALGANRTCALLANGTVACWGDGIIMPSYLADAQFIAIQAKGGAFCGILTANYSLVCWGDEAFHRNPMVFDRVLPGACTHISKCSCGVLLDSGDICVTGVICRQCKLALQPDAPPSLPTGHRKRGSSERRLVFLVVGAAGLGVCSVAAVSIYLLFRLSNKRGRVHDSGRLDETPDLPESLEPPTERQLSYKVHESSVEEFPLDVLRAATNGFAEEYKIGSGSFGSVYHAALADGREVAIKRADFHSAALTYSSSCHVAKVRRGTESAFGSELALLSRVNHKNLVRLLGYCQEGPERVLVYEFMPNGTLRDHLRRPPAGSPLASWRARLRAALDAARGIEYLHAYAEPPIIHRDIKSSNILLDGAWTAKVSDFGLSLMDPSGEEDGGARAAAGTVGYMDPEYYRLRRLTAKSDVYSFGVVLLELLTGSKVVERYGECSSPRNVVERAVPRIEEEGVGGVLDPRLPAPAGGEAEAVAAVGYMAADCVSAAGRDRPSMREVVGALERSLAACDSDPIAFSATTRCV